eukprot:bmy_04280T0
MTQTKYCIDLTQKESPCPSDTTSRTNKLAVDVNGVNFGNENDLSEVSFLLHDGNKALPCLQESIRRNSASAAAQRKTGSCFAEVSCGTGWEEGPQPLRATEDRATKESLGSQDYHPLKNGQKWGFVRMNHQLMFSEQTVEYKKMLSCEKSTPNDLQITLALLALQPFELANLLCHN